METLASHKPYLNAVVSETILNAFLRGKPNGESQALDPLTAREREIVQWMRTGMSNKEIARELGISDMTVKTHAHNIFNKLEVSGRLRLFGVRPASDPPLAGGVT